MNRRGYLKAMGMAFVAVLARKIIPKQEPRPVILNVNQVRQGPDGLYRFGNSSKPIKLSPAAKEFEKQLKKGKPQQVDFKFLPGDD